MTGGIKSTLPSERAWRMVAVVWLSVCLPACLTVWGPPGSLIGPSGVHLAVETGRCLFFFLL